MTIAILSLRGASAGGTKQSWVNNIIAAPQSNEAISVFLSGGKERLIPYRTLRSHCVRNDKKFLQDVAQSLRCASLVMTKKILKDAVQSLRCAVIGKTEKIQ